MTFEESCLDRVRNPVIKLFIIDLANIGGIERIVSFLAVGVLMLVIGYVAPVPPRQRPEAI